MLLVIDNFDQFKVFFDVIYDITDLIEFQLFKTHMVCSILDKAHTRFMSVKYLAEFFSVYDVGDGESVTVFAEDLHKVIKSANKIDTVTLETNEDYMVCKVESKNGNSRIFEFVLPADYIESPAPPSLQLPISFSININDIKQAITDLKIIGSNIIKFVVMEGAVNITTGIETSTNYSANINVDVSVDYPTYSKFNLEYIEQLLKFDKINKTVDFQIGDNNPLIYSFSDEIMGVVVDGMIAPMMEMD